MTDTLVARPTPVELSDDPRFARRVRRLALTAIVALGAIWSLAVSTLQAPAPVGTALLLGWMLMPAILFASLTRPLLRYGLVVPATLVGVPLLVVCVAWLPDSPVAAAGWVAITAGIALGGVLGLWFWYRLAPVPAGLDHPFSAGRLMLIAIHVASIVVGIVLAATPLFGG